MAKELTFELECREKLVRGVKKIGGAVKSTLGPRGLKAVLDRSWGEPKVTADGATVAEEVELKDRVENVAARIVRAAAEKTSREVGDGSTTCTVLAEAMYLEGVRAVTSGNWPPAVSSGHSKLSSQAAAKPRPSRKPASPARLTTKANSALPVASRRCQA